MGIWETRNLYSVHTVKTIGRKICAGAVIFTIIFQVMFTNSYDVTTISSDVHYKY